jgi:hypothetical protein
VWYAVDIYGNLDSCIMQVFIFDETPPVITCPENIIVNSDIDLCEAWVDVPQPLVFDNCGAQAAINDYTGTTNASAVYPVGITVVWWYVVDIYGNGDSCMMTVTVIDTQAPDITCPDNVTGYSWASGCEGYVTVLPATATDNCAVDSIWNSYNNTGNASDMYPVGITDVTWQYRQL